MNKFLKGLSAPLRVVIFLLLMVLSGILKLIGALVMFVVTVFGVAAMVIGIIGCIGGIVFTLGAFLHPEPMTIPTLIIVWLGLFIWNCGWIVGVSFGETIASLGEKISVYAKSLIFLKPQNKSSVNQTDTTTANANQELKFYVDEFERVYSECSTNFEYIDKLNRTLNQRSPLINEMLDEFNSNIATWKAIGYKFSSGNVYVSEADMICRQLSQCCLNLQILKNKQLQHIRELEYYKSKTNTSSGGTATGAYSESSSFFAGCNNLESLTKRYKDLCKVYHPDMGNGSQEVFQQINNEYEMLKAKL